MIRYGCPASRFVEGLLQTLDGHDEVDAERGAAEIEICLELLRREDLGTAQLAAGRFDHRLHAILKLGRRERIAWPLQIPRCRCGTLLLLGQAVAQQRALLGQSLITLEQVFACSILASPSR